MTSKLLVAFLLLTFSGNVFAWGKTGHRIVGELAQRNLTEETKKEIRKLVGHEDLARVSNWPDEIKSLQSYSFANPWHYVNIPKGKKYFDQTRSPKGDIVEALFRLEELLRSDKSSLLEKQEALKFYVHFMGDLHQPMHTGYAEDYGGGKVNVMWFKKPSSLHAVWDEDMVLFEEYSYTEYASQLNHYKSGEKDAFIKGTFLDWAYDSRSYLDDIYAYNMSVPLSYEYHFHFKPVMELGFRKAGIRLAHRLNSIFAKKYVGEEFKSMSKKVRENI